MTDTVKRIREFKLYPKPDQEQALWAVLRSTYTLSNLLLDEWTTAFKRGTFTRKNDHKKIHTVPVHPDLDSRLIEDVFDRTYASIDRWLNYRKALKKGVKGLRRVGFPKPRKWRDWRSFGYSFRPDSVHGRYWDGGKCLGRIKFRGSLPAVPHKSCQVVRKADGWYLQLVCSIELPEPEPAALPEVGLDLGVSRLVTDSAGGYVENPRFLEKDLERLRDATRAYHRQDRRAQHRQQLSNDGIDPGHLFRSEITTPLCFACGAITATTWKSKVCECQACGARVKRQDNSRRNLDNLSRLVRRDPSLADADLPTISAAYAAYLKERRGKVPNPQLPHVRSKRKGRCIRQMRRIGEHVANCRRLHAHAVSRRYVDRYQVIRLEDLDSSQLIEQDELPGMSRRLADAAHYQLRQYLIYKGQDAGRTVTVGRAALTTRLCSQCGQDAGTTFADRWHRCPHCGYCTRRQRNSAQNVVAFIHLDLAAGAGVEHVVAAYREWLREHPLQGVKGEQQIGIW